MKLKCAFSSFSCCCWRQLNCVTVCKSLLKKIRPNIGNSPTGMCQSKLMVFLFSSWNSDIQSCSFITMDARFACAQYRTVCPSNWTTKLISHCVKDIPVRKVHEVMNIKSEVIKTLNVTHLFYCNIVIFQQNPQTHWCLYPTEAWEVLLGKSGTCICSNSRTTISTSTIFWSCWLSKFGFCSPENSCHKVWSFITVMQPHTVHIKH